MSQFFYRFGTQGSNIKTWAGEIMWNDLFLVVQNSSCMAAVLLIQFQLLSVTSSKMLACWWFIPLFIGEFRIQPSSLIDTNSSFYWWISNLCGFESASLGTENHIYFRMFSTSILLIIGFVWKCRVPHCTQWFCWSLSLWKWLAIIGNINPTFSDKPNWRVCLKMGYTPN